MPDVPVACGGLHRHAFHCVPHDACKGATIVLPIASWERRFILERFIDTAQSDDFDGGGGEDGSGGSADGFYGVMLMSSTHHRFSGLYTIRRPGAPPVTQLLVRGSPA
eukprot:scaffold42292_cov67-Phaeocystis_antarctica.AAC.2